MKYSNKNRISCMLITANVGTIFEESSLLDLWFEQLNSYVADLKPQFLAIHCQEIGGKNYESSIERNLSTFVDKFLNDEKLSNEYDKLRIFLDEDFECLEKFTALGSLYLIHKSIENVKLYNFKTNKLETLEGRQVFTGKQSELKAQHVEKVKFPQKLFPECRSSRKGFMRTRWLFAESTNVPIDMVNIHLFHDASNLIAMNKAPSPYAQSRQKALEYTLSCLDKPLPINNDDNDDEQNTQLLSEHENKAQQKFNEEENLQNNNTQVPLFIFGDFNFRLDTNKVIQRITAGMNPTVKRADNSDEVVEVVYHRHVRQTELASKLSELDSIDCGDSNNIDEKVSIDVNDGLNKSLVNQEEKAIQKQHKTIDDGSSSNHSVENANSVVMTIGKKTFDCENLDETFRAAANTKWLLEMDNELDSFKTLLHEFKISFSPSYPFKEDAAGGYSYMKTRCPAWCDRILFNTAGKKLIEACNYENKLQTKELISNSQSISDKCNTKIECCSTGSLQRQPADNETLYTLLGSTVPMGDHKPVFLHCELKFEAL